MKAYASAAYERSGDLLSRATAAFHAAGSRVEGWATFYDAASAVNAGEFDRADDIIHRVIAVASEEQPTLVGKAVWALGVTQLRRGNYDNAIRLYRAAQRDIDRAGERENQGALSYILAEALILEGQSVTGSFEAYRGLRLLAPFRRSVFLNNNLSIVATYAREAGFTRAALEIMNEVLDVAPAIGNADVMAWALCARARDLIALGRFGAARADLDSAVRWTSLIVDGRGRDRVVADVKLVESVLLRDQDPRKALQLLADVEAAFRRVHIELNMPVMLYELAVTAQSMRDTTRALSKLWEAVAWLDRQRSTLQTTESRATHAETTEHVFDMLIELESTRKNDQDAFAALEQGRIAGRATVGNLISGAPSRGRHLGDISARLPTGMVLVEYAVLKDRLLVWTLSQGSWHAHSVLVSRDSIAQLVERFEEEAARPVRMTSDASAILFDILIRPIATELARSKQLAIVADRELFRLPFSALWDRDSSRYLVESFELRMEPSAAFLLEVLGRRRASRTGIRSSALIIGAPALDSLTSNRLPALPGARREAEQIAALYPRHTLLTGTAARKSEFLRGAVGATVVHFAGHAVFNGERPELSFLALSPDSAADDGVLRAREIGKLRLSNVEVAVLSACSTLSPRVTRNGSLAGLAYSFLQAGVPATVSTLWEVSDDVTSRLLVDFHRLLVAGESPAAALRLVQLHALKSDLPELRAPRAWAAFLFVGG